jgi:hypothetical protein
LDNGAAKRFDLGYGSRQLHRSKSERSWPPEFDHLNLQELKARLFQENVRAIVHFGEDLPIQITVEITVTVHSIDTRD